MTYATLPSQKVYEAAERAKTRGLDLPDDQRERLACLRNLAWAAMKAVEPITVGIDDFGLISAHYVA